MKNRNRCDCDICQRGRKLQTIIDTLPSKENKKYFTAYVNNMYESEADLEYQNCIMDGSWPQAVEILERRLKLAKEIRAIKQEEENAKRHKRP